MTDVLGTLFDLIYLLAIVGGVGWWIWVVRRSRQQSRPTRTEQENAELLRLRALLSPPEGTPGPDEPSR